MSILRTAALSAAFAMGLAGAASAAVFGFDSISNNDPTDALIGESQLFVEVTGGAGSVDFRFFNTGPENSSITAIYFDDDTVPLLFTSVTPAITNSTGVSFSAGATPPNLPGGNSLDPSFTSIAAADSDAPVEPNGVNPGEEVTLSFALGLDGGGAQYTADDVVASLVSAALRIGLQVQGFDGGGSEQYVNNPEVIPLPATALLLLGGIGGLGVFSARRKV